MTLMALPQGRGQACESDSDWGPEEEEDASEDTQEEEESSEDEGRSGDGAPEAVWEDVQSYGTYGEAMQDGLLEDDEEEEEEIADAADANDAQEHVRRAAALKV